MTLRILLASDHYPPFIGGAHRQTQLLGGELLRRGHAVTVATVWHPGLPALEDDHGVPVYRLRQVRTALASGALSSANRPADGKRQQRHQPPMPDPLTTWGLRRLIERFQPNVIHAYGWYAYSVAAALAGKSIPLLISARDYAYGCATRTLVQRGEHVCSGPALDKCLDCAGKLYGAPKGASATLGVRLGDLLLRRKVTGIHSISTYVQQMVHRDFLDGAAGEDVGIVEAIIPSFRENDAAERYDADPAVQPYLERLPAEPYILFVGALRRVKGVEQLLAAYTRLRAAPPLVLIGTYEHDSPRSFPPGVSVLSDVPHRAVMAAWDRALFGVIPSLWPEPLGSVVYEGMSRGKALVGTRPGGHTDMIVDGQTGLLTPLGDVEALTQAMQQLIDHPELCAALGRAAQQRSLQFTAAVNVPRFEQLYGQLVQRGLEACGHSPRTEAVSS